MYSSFVALWCRNIRPSEQLNGKTYHMIVTIYISQCCINIRSTCIAIFIELEFLLCIVNLVLQNNLFLDILSVVMSKQISETFVISFFIIDINTYSDIKTLITNTFSSYNIMVKRYINDKTLFIYSSVL